MTTRQTNRKPQEGDLVLRYSYIKHEYEKDPTGRVHWLSGPAVGEGYYVTLMDDSIVAVEVNPESIVDDPAVIWKEQHPKVTPRA